ncbi:MAG: flagellar biosynthesis protein FlhB [Desulfobacter sp.]|jgi:flagellar biosynthetic protein FlhB|uniref:flagellar biosynthesis protein FlhB n=1 Tax=Desulfobacter sp. TaxID=2294 RepID=UPI001B541761|nr:flagellar biosynthesis protein FlhB [Desulfobacter sp.]MBP8828561.1 flagellar biosynthesis protein FlhB [Desulfobacter sp.]MBP9597534.1 flagellar biosynthesis protein FlhB [Desulfobacter sp.]MDQ1270884.1 flagellar biosynthesis protein FlhB [Thermodesulfobacteriota bacterium]
MAEDPEGGGEKTEDASSRKLDKAREEGQVTKSMEIPSVFVLLGGVTALYTTAFFFYQNCVEVFHYNFIFERVPELNPADLTALLIYHAKKMFFMCLPVFAAVCVVALVSNLAQVGFHVSWKAIEPKLSKLNPINGFKQKFSSRALIEFVKSLVKIAVISLVCYLATKGELSKVLTLYDNSTAQILLFLLIKSFWIFIKVCLVMTLVAILDYAFQKWKFLEEQKMTKKEVKDEHKQTEGDPAVKSRIRQLQMAAARKRMMAAVPKADVVVTNPTHLAVALQYDREKMVAPTVVAKGAGAVAENIKKIAQENDVPIVEDKPLARNLYKSVDIGGQIPFEYYQTVAELLAYVYGLKNS